MLLPFWKVIKRFGAPAIIYLLVAQAETFAIPVKLSFAGNVFSFPAHTIPYTPPTLSGQFIYEAASLYSPIEALISVDLTIAGHAFSISELGFVNRGGIFSTIGALLNDVEGVSGGTIDFVFPFTRTLGGSGSLMFADGLPNSFHSISGFDMRAYSVTTVSTAVPDLPSTVGLMILGLSGMLFTKHGRRRGWEKAFG